MLNYADIAKKFGLEEIQPEVVQLNQLFKRDAFDLSALVSILERDRRMSTRMLQIANHKAAQSFGNDRDYPVVTTVEAAVKCAGVDAAIAIAMAEPLSNAVTKTFETMLHMDVHSNFGTYGLVLDVPHIMGRARFGGRAAGEVQFRMSRIFAYEMAARILRAAPSELNTAEVFDVVGELVNMIVGNFKSFLCYEGLSGHLSTPTVEWSKDFTLIQRAGGASERLLFTSQELILFVDNVLEPFNNETTRATTPTREVAA